MKQIQFLKLNCLEALFGGAVGGGKSDSLLMAALQYVHVPGYAAVLFRRTYADLAKPGALMSRSHEWLQGKAHWNGTDKIWTFPSGATISFGYLDTDKDKYHYQSSEYQFIGFDELTQFRLEDYTYLFSRLRQRYGINVTLRMRGATNPGGEGHEWVKERFITNPADRVFIPSKIADNPGLNEAEYRLMLANLDHVTRDQLEHGDWDAVTDGNVFNRDWFAYWKEEGEFYRTNRGVFPKESAWVFATADLALTEKETADYTVVCVWAVLPSGELLLLDLWRDKVEAPKSWKLIQEWEKKWKWEFIEVERVQYQMAAVQHLRGEGLAVKAYNPKGDKRSRAMSASIRFEAGMVYFPSGNPEWLSALEREMLTFKGDDVGHDDQVDNVSSACKLVSQRYSIVNVPKRVKEHEDSQMTVEQREEKQKEANRPLNENELLARWIAESE